jgi:hypothetical protein
MHQLRAAPAPSSFWMGGYEGADHVNGAGEALDLVAATGHDRRLEADYRAARRLGLRCLRESIGWRLTERPGGEGWDLSRAVRMAQAARCQGVQILWTLMHYGVPSDLTLLDDALVPRFARFCAEVARVLMPLCPAPRTYTPINEISFLSWAASATGDMGPAGVQGLSGEGDSRTSGYLIKQRLVRAALAGMAAIRAVDPRARFLHVEPVVHVAPCDEGDAEQCELARRISSFQWQALDMLAGRMDPQLGGHADALDWLGLNHYHTSQWEVPGEKRLAWHLRDPRRRPLSQLLHEVWRRYRRPLLLAETGHIGVGRADWLHEVAGEALRARAMGVPLQGVCLYPLLDRPDWNDTRRWHRSGLWHVPGPADDARTVRRLNRPYARALLEWQGLNDMRPPAPPPEDQPGLLVPLPCAWEDWHAPRRQWLDAWRARGLVRLLEPPRAAACEPRLRCHTLAPGAELLVLHGGGPGGWRTAPDATRLALLRQALAEAGPRRWAVCLPGWPADGHAGWWRELAPAGQLAPPEVTCTPRRCLPQGYEAEELDRLLASLSPPLVWLALRPHEPDGLAALLPSLCVTAQAQPARQFVVAAPRPLEAGPLPPNLHWLGRVHDSLHAALGARVQAVVRV